MNVLIFSQAMSVAVSFSVVQAGQNGKCACPAMALRAVICFSPQGSVPHYRPCFFTLGAELPNGLGSNVSWAAAWTELQPSLPASGEGQPELCPSCCWEGKVPTHCQLQVTNLGVTGRAVLSWHWAPTHRCFHKVSKANSGCAVADGSGLQIKSQANFFSCQRSNPDNPLPGVSERDHWVSPL